MKLPHRTKRREQGREAFSAVRIDEETSRPVCPDTCCPGLSSFPSVQPRFCTSRSRPQAPLPEQLRQTQPDSSWSWSCPSATAAGTAEVSRGRAVDSFDATVAWVSATGTTGADEIASGLLTAPVDLPPESADPTALGGCAPEFVPLLRGVRWSARGRRNPLSQRERVGVREKTRFNPPASARPRSVLPPRRAGNAPEQAEAHVPGAPARPPHAPPPSPGEGVRSKTAAP